MDITDLLNSPIGSRAVNSKNILAVVDETSVPGKPVGDETLLRDHFRLLADPSQLKGPSRFAVDGFLTKDECQSLMDLELVR